MTNLEGEILHQFFDQWENKRGHLKEIPSFSFRRNSSITFGIIVIDLGERQRPEQEEDIYNIPFSDKVNIILHAHHKPYTRTLSIAFNQWRKNEIFQWLQGFGRFETSNDPYVHFEAYISKVTKPRLYKQGLITCEIELMVNPYAYLNSGETEITIASGMTLHNPGTWIAQPTLSVFGSGNGEIAINGRSIYLSDIEKELVINSHLKKIYREQKNEGQKMQGDFPYLDLGASKIEYTGGITSLSMIPGWCYL